MKPTLFFNLKFSITLYFKVTYLLSDKDGCNSGLLLKKSVLNITEKWRGLSAFLISLREWVRQEMNLSFLLWLIEMQVDFWLFSGKQKICLGDCQLFYTNIRYGTCNFPPFCYNISSDWIRITCTDQKFILCGMK